MLRVLLVRHSHPNVNFSRAHSHERAHAASTSLIAASSRSPETPRYRRFAIRRANGLPQLSRAAVHDLFREAAARRPERPH